jgi:hypothetical protein
MTRNRPADLLPPAASCLVVLAAAAPWLLGFGSSHAAVANGIAFAMAFAPLALLIAALRPAAAVCVAGGAWLAASPWLLGYAAAGAPAWAADLLLGAALAAVSWRAAPRGTRAVLPARELRPAGRRAARPRGDSAPAIDDSRAA